jgi:hypothetical protein
MKAEHRKELQTNSLADFLGRLLQKRQTGTGISWFPVAIVAFVCLAIFVFFWIRGNNVRANSEAWANVGYGTWTTGETIVAENPESKQARVARNSRMSLELWFSIRQVGAAKGVGPVKAVETIQAVLPGFEKLVADYKLAEDIEFEAEARYGVFVCHECMAIADSKYLEIAKKDLEDLSEGKLGETAYGRIAKKRLEQFTTESASISAFYADLKLRSSGFGN